MKKLLLLVACIFLSTVSHAQIAPKASSTPDQDVVKISTNLIQIDVSVTDNKGNPVPDLKRDEIEIYENGKKQAISNFSFVTNIKRGQAAKPPKDAVILPGVTPRPENVRRTIAIVVDDLSLSFESAFSTREAVKKYVREQIQDGDLVAIIRTGAGVGALQQFTTDRRQLLAAAEKIKFNLAGTGRIGIFNPIEGSLAERMESEGAEEERQFQRENEQFRESIFASGTLGALNYVIRGMQDLPGRKSIVLLSGGFRLYERNQNGTLAASRILDPLRRLIDFANRASVVFYSIDTRGLVYTGLTAADSTSDLSVEQTDQRLIERRDELYDTQDGLSFLARETGGFTVLNSNNITQGIGRALKDESYYLVGYEPPDETFDPKSQRYNRLEVRVSRPGTKVRYRSGFFGFTDKNIDKPSTSAQQAVLTALTSPFASNDISVRLNAMFAADEKKKPYLKSFLHVDAGQLTFEPDPQGGYKTVFDIVALSFGDNGLVADEVSKTYTMNVKEEAYQQIQKQGFVYQFAFPVKKPGGYQIRVALRDSKRNRVGSANQFVEIPDVKKKRVVLSGVVLESIDASQWERINKDPAVYEEIKKVTDPMMATTLRQFKRGSVLRWGASAYNVGRMGKPQTRQIKLYRDGKLVLEGPPVPISAIGTDGTANLQGTLQFGSSMDLGEYIMQIIVTSADGKDKKNAASQFVQFEIIG